MERGMLTQFYMVTRTTIVKYLLPVESKEVSYSKQFIDVQLKKRIECN